MKVKAKKPQIERKRSLFLLILVKSTSFAETAKQQFEVGTLETKRKIIQPLGSNLYLADKTLTIELTEPLELIKGVAPEVCAAVKQLDPLNQVQNECQNSLERCLVKNGGAGWTGLEPVCLQRLFNFLRFKILPSNEN